jgi:uncharacterized protein (TIGR00661 family)
MRIMYGVVGEGMGHAMRSIVLLEELTRRGHEVRIVGSGRAAEYLEKRFPGTVTTITGLTMVYEDNVVKKLKTAFKNLKAAAGIPENFLHYAELARSFSPEVVVSDFESFTYWFARGQRIPVVSVDNMQIIARCRHDKEVLAGERGAYLLAKSIVKAKLPRCNAYLITTFFYPPPKKKRTTLHPPVLRKVILDAKARVKTGDHVLVYQSGTSHDTLIDELKRIEVPFKVYGLRRGIQAEEQDGNLIHCPFSEDKFIDDLATCKAVIAGGGFTLMGEAVYLGKPMLSVPLGGQFEQTLNASYLAKLGYGERVDHLSQKKVEKFLARAPRYAETLSSFEHDGNTGLLEQLGRSLDQAVAEGSRG